MPEALARKPSGLLFESRSTCPRREIKKRMTGSSKASERISSMAHELSRFERIVRDAHLFTEEANDVGAGHPFDARNIHPELPVEVRKLFDDGHYAQATFEALKFLDEEVQRI